MQWQNNPFFPLIAISSLIAAACAVFVATRRNRSYGATALLGLILSVVVWGAAYSLELSSANLVWGVFWAKVEYVGVPFVPLFFFLFAYQFTQNERKLSSLKTFALFLISSTFTLLAWTNEYHHFVWTEFSQDSTDGYVMLALGHGLAFWLLIAYSYILLLIAFIHLVYRVINSPPEFKKQAYIILAGGGVTWLGNIIYVLGISPVPQLDLTPVSFVISSVIFSFGFFSAGMLDIMPIAGEFILESLDDAIIVTNPKGMIVYANRAFEYFFNLSPLSLVGKQATQAFSEWSALKSLFENSETIRREIAVAPQGRAPVVFNVRIFNIRLNNTSEVIGRITMLDDVTERRAAEHRLNQPYIESNSNELPVMAIFRANDDKIVDVNRAFLLALGYERKDVIGRSLGEIQFWETDQRADFLRALYKNGSLKDTPFKLKKDKDSARAYLLSATQIEAQDLKYVMILLREDWA
ncbi:MAG: PAS domain-containing protein [Anaerolineales bacterium]|nr:PAS domain-containing protein [Anaerolineales bacterium]